MAGHVDRRVRSGAQLELAARNKSSSFSEIALDSSANPMARLHSVWGLAHVARRNAEARSSSAKSLAQLLGDKDASIRAAAVQGLSDAGLDAAQVRPYEAAIVKLLKDTEPRVQYCAAIASDDCNWPAHLNLRANCSQQMPMKIPHFVMELS